MNRLAILATVIAGLIPAIMTALPRLIMVTTVPIISIS
jgi:hypothetical protein